MVSRGLRARIFGVVVGAATVESVSLTPRSLSIKLLSSAASASTASASRLSPPRMRSSPGTTMTVADSVVDAGHYAQFIKEKVCVEYEFYSLGMSMRVHAMLVT